MRSGQRTSAFSGKARETLSAAAPRGPGFAGLAEECTLRFACFLSFGRSVLLPIGSSEGAAPRVSAAPRASQREAQSSEADQ